ncbi:MAG: TonB-dependent receptor [Methylophilaceae bacterium]
MSATYSFPKTLKRTKKCLHHYDVNSYVAFICLVVASTQVAQSWVAVASAENNDSQKNAAWYNRQEPKLPSTSSTYGVAPGILLAAETTDTTPQGASPMPSANKPGIALPNVNIQLNEIRVTAKRIKDIGPLPGLNLTKEQIPGNIQSITAQEIKDTQSLSITDLLNTKLQSVNVNDYQGNPFQMDLTYRGFTAGPQIGSQQGLSVFFDGIRVNEPFGDVVNWDMIPMNAISGLDVFPGSNPLFGLNTLGGAIAIKTKGGFDSPGISAQILKGSFGRDQLQASAGWNNGSLAAFGAVNLFMEDGWRDNSPSKVNQAFGKLEWQGEQASLGLSTLAVVNKLVGNGTVPIELYNENPSAVYTSPDVTRNRLLQIQLSGAFEVSDIFNITGMVYNRDSRRTSSTGDIIDIDTFRDLGRASRRANPGENISCTFLDANGDGFPNYYLDELTETAPGSGVYTSAFIQDVQAHLPEVLNQSYTPDYSLLTSYNTGLPASYIQRATDIVKRGDTGAPALNYTDAFGQQQFFRFAGGLYTPFEVGIGAVGAAGYPNGHFTRRNADGSYTRYNVILDSVINPNCETVAKSGDGTKLYPVDANGNPIIVQRDGALNGYAGAMGTGTGYVEGTPTAVITNSLIDQSGQGGGLQFNWNLDAHKFMVGLSIDRAAAKYNATQRFGLIDSQRNVYSDPNSIGEEYYAASHDVLVNAFEGSKTTESIYASETWTPTQTLNFSASARYNDTYIKNKLAPKAKYFGLSDPALLNHYLAYVTCSGTDTSNCVYDPSKMISAEEYAKLIGRDFAPLSSAITEKFTYASLNPAFGVTWQTTPRLNMYFNWNQGTRTPSVIELGCAYDDTPTMRRDINGNPILGAGGKPQYGPATLVDGRACNLPSVLSGDPYLPQVQAQTYEIGVRGKFKDLLEWNITGYRTMLRDDIYMVSATSELSYFQSIGDTLRQGIEFGLQGNYGRSEFRVNYSLTEATFQSAFKMLSANNSNIISNDTRSADYNQIQVEPGDRMPGVPLNNMNISWGYKVTPAFKVSLSMVAHGDSFVRGNENNEHTAGPSRGIIKGVTDSTGTVVYTNVPGPDYRYSGKSPGYAVFNFRGTYDLGKGWTLGMMVNNLLDKQYFSAGRLGLTPFAPSTYGAIGAGGFNYNSSEWLSTQFMSAGAPRGVWLTVGYDFDASKKSQPASNRPLPTEPDRTLLPQSRILTPEELAVEKAMDITKPLPVLKRDLAKSASDFLVAEQQVGTAIENWRAALVAGDADGYLNSYATDFSQDGMSHEAWIEQRKLELATAGRTSMQIDNLIVAPQGKGMTAIFTQSSPPSNKAGQPQTLFVRKALGLEQQEGRWVIVRENVLKTPVRKAETAPLGTGKVNNGAQVERVRVSILNKGAK